MQITTKGVIKKGATAEDVILALLKQRGYKSRDEQRSFLHPAPLTLDYLHSESGLSIESLNTMQKILDSHISLDHDICVFGDYDADGITATAILYLALRTYIQDKASNSRLLPFIPDRHRHGYGLSNLAVEDVVTGAAFESSSYPDFRPKLVITVDTGIVAHAGVSNLIGNGIAVVITDHHLPPQADLPAQQDLPDAACIVHTTMTSGAGIAYVVASHLLGSADNYQDLATVGVVADMIPLTGFNRSLVVAGLTALTKTNNLGLRALMDHMGITKRRLTTYDISYGIAPRINAAGRIVSPLDALRLLCTTDVAQSIKLAREIDSHNTSRQELTDTALTHALKEGVAHKCIAIIGPYHEGVIGLVAGKLMEKHARPVVVMSENGDVVKGSARSVSGFNITDFLRSLKTPFLGLGGHEGAAGFSVSRDNVQALLNEIKVLGDQVIDDSLLVKRETADLELPLTVSTMSLAHELAGLEPYGIGNSRPRFLFKDLAVIEDRAMGEGDKHHKLLVEQDGVTRTLLMFNTTHLHPLTHINQCIATIDINVWNNKESLQLVSSYVQN